MGPCEPAVYSIMASSVSPGAMEWRGRSTTLKFFEETSMRTLPPGRTVIDKGMS